jgi:hypothetical protein
VQCPYTVRHGKQNESNRWDYGWRGRAPTAGSDCHRNSSNVVDSFMGDSMEAKPSTIRALPVLRLRSSRHGRPLPGMRDGPPSPPGRGAASTLSPSPPHSSASCLKIRLSAPQFNHVVKSPEECTSTGPGNLSRNWLQFLNSGKNKSGEKPSGLRVFRFGSGGFSSLRGSCLVLSVFSQLRPR